MIDLNYNYEKAQKTNTAPRRQSDADKGSTITLNTGNFLAAGTTGIEEIGVTREEKIKNTKTYNLMGQQVNRATAKGLLIRDGKKYINKK